METHTDCAYCLDGFCPAGALPILGPLYLACTDCQPACCCCDGLAVFPADHRDLLNFVKYLADLELVGVFCPGCYGVRHIVPLDTNEAIR